LVPSGAAGENGQQEVGASSAAGAGQSHHNSKDNS
jgi:hypothetical protein